MAIATAAPDIDRLNSLSREINGLYGAGRLTKADYTRILAEAVAASAGHGDLVTFVYAVADPAWTKDDFTSVR
jgi:vacuolar-type H+-ATPase subunit B/Vma2